MVEYDPQSRQVPFEEETGETEVTRQELELEEVAIQESTIETEVAEIEEDEIEEGEYANQLALEQEQAQYQQEAGRIYEEGNAYGHPSFFKYFVILIPWAVIVDIVDGLDLTGIGAIVATIFSVLSTGAILFILWFTDGKLKSAQDYHENLEQEVTNLQKDIAMSTKLALRGSRALRKVPGMKAVARQIPRTLVKIRRIARKNPITKVLIGGALNAIPFIAVLNLLCVWVYFSYRDEKKAFRGAQEAAQEAYEQLSQNISEVV